MNAIGGNPHQALQNDLPDPTSNNMVTSAKFAINSCTFLFLGFDAMVKALSTSVSSTKIVPGLSMESNDISRLCAQLVYTSKLVEADYSQYAPIRYLRSDCNQSTLLSCRLRGRSSTHLAWANFSSVKNLEHVSIDEGERAVHA